MELDDTFSEHILARHEKPISGADIARLAFKETIRRISLDKKDAVRRETLAREMKSSVQMLIYALQGLGEKKRKKEEKREKDKQVQTFLKKKALIAAGKSATTQAEIDTITEEQYYMYIAILQSYKSNLRGKQKKRIEDMIKQALETMKVKGYATDIREINEIVLCIPEEERKELMQMIRKMLPR